MEDEEIMNTFPIGLEKDVGNTKILMELVEEVNKMIGSPHLTLCYDGREFWLELRTV